MSERREIKQEKKKKNYMIKEGRENNTEKKK